MSLFITQGTPIPTRLPIPETLEKVFPPPQVAILRSPQHQDAWCYAACAEMVIHRCIPSPFVDQCKVAGFVKNSNCCLALVNAICINSGCKEDDIKRIFDHFGVVSQRLNQQISPVQVTTEVTASPGRPIEVVIHWQVGAGQSSSHAVLIAGISGEFVFIVDPLRLGPFNGWRTFVSLQNGFGHGHWALTWVGLRKAN
jgi:hypothetical protein